MDESTLSNVLIHQKDKLRSLVFDGQYEQAHSLLEFVRELWEVSSYGYKYREVRDLLKESMRQHVLDAEHWKEKEKWEKLYHKLFPIEHGLAS